MRVETYGRLADGDNVDLYRLQTDELEVNVISYGGRIVSVRAPARDGRMGEVTLGYDTLDGYLADSDYLGAIIGRYANRIGNARFPLGDRIYEVVDNDGRHSLHGGRRGFDKQLWQARALGAALELRYVSADGEEGYPGALDVTVLYTVSQSDLRIDYRARADRDTIVNLTNHMYFNLSSDPAQEIVQHELMLRAEHYTPVTKTLVPTGEIRNVSDTPFDFRQCVPIGARIGDDHEQLRFARGYDHNWVLAGDHGLLRPVAELRELNSGRRMEVLTTEPGLQFYSGNQLSQSGRTSTHKGHGYRCGLCLETQHFPDSPNHPHFPSTRLAAHGTYESSTIYRFSVQ